MWWQHGGEVVPSYSMVNRSTAEFKHGTESLEDDPRPKRLATDISTDYNKEEICVPNNCWTKCVNMRGNYVDKCDF